MLGGTREPLLTPNDMRDPHQMIIHNIGEVIRGITIRLEQHLVVDLVGGEFHTPSNEIIKGNATRIGNLHTHDIRESGFNLLLYLFFSKLQSSAVVLWRYSHSLLVLPHLLQLFSRIECTICLPRIEKHLCMLLVNGKPLRLNIRSLWTALHRTLVEIKSCPPQCVDQIINRTLNVARSVRIFDAKYKRAVVFPCKQKIIQRGAKPTDVEISCWTWSEADPNG